METTGAAAWMSTPQGELMPIEGSWSAGRSKHNNLILTHEKASRRHALIQRCEDGQYWLVDLGSNNGTFVNGRRISLPVALRDGDEVEFAHLRLVFHLAPDAAAWEPVSTGHQVTETDYQTVPCWLLIADLQSFTRLSQSVAAAQLSLLTGRWLAACRLAVESNGGTVNKYLGDGFFAYWRDEPDLRSGVVTALRQLIVHQATHEPSFRMVLHHGEVGFGGAGASGEDNLTGAEVNFAFRMEKLAAALAVPRLLSAAAQARLADLIEVTPAGHHQLAGFPEPHPFFVF